MNVVIWLINRPPSRGVRPSQLAACAASLSPGSIVLAKLFYRVRSIHRTACEKLLMGRNLKETTRGRWFVCREDPRIARPRPSSDNVEGSANTMCRPRVRSSKLRHIPYVNAGNLYLTHLPAARPQGDNRPTAFYLVGPAMCVIFRVIR